ncbi:MAG: hypothetical protein M1823_001789 [Watsoniomyces obsoletus]|nr:MAG: hypothetical protein M1823_001789 [Watsoniomyces obsoletus]
MRILNICTLLGLLSSTLGATQSPRDYTKRDYYALHLAPSVQPQSLCERLGLEYEEPLGELPEHHLCSSPRRQEDMVKGALRDFRRRRRRRDEGLEPHVLNGVLLSQKQIPKRRLFKRTYLPSLPLAPRQDWAAGASQSSPSAKQREIARSLDIRDPIFPDQWHLFNPIQHGHDLNVSGVWGQGITGRDIIVAIIDDGLDMDSEDLKNNYFAEGSYDFNDHGLEPRPRLDDDRHGTRCAGEIAAVKNSVCGVGVAWDAKVAGIRILSKEIPESDEAVAMNYAYQKNHIYSCSWGPPDDGAAMDAPGILIRRAMVNGIQNGRGGKGSVFVFASGNGANNGDNCNFDGYTNSIYSITVGAIDRTGAHPYYSEMCSAHLVVTYSSGGQDAIHTTDVGVNKCYSHHGGTSAAAPLAAGVFALVLSVRPDLTWRDLQYLTLDTAIPVNVDDASSDWQKTSIGKHFSHKYGYGKLDAYAIVEAAKTFKSVKPQAWYNSPWMHVKQDVPQGDRGLASTIEVTKEELFDANLERLEHVTVTMNVAHTQRGDLSVELRSPAGMVSHLSVARKNDKAKIGYVDWTFMTVVHWGETGIGNWTVIVKDTVVNKHQGSLTDWKMTLWGECIDESRAKLLPMPTEEDDDDHDKTATVTASTTSIATTGLPTVVPTANPTDHIHRPVNERPSDGNAPAATSTSSADADVSASPGTGNNLLPSFFPTFGVSKRNQVWIYGSIAIIVLFCVGIGIYLYMARRKRIRNNLGDNYEFEVLDDQDEVEGGNGGTRKPSRRRGGELYDAFAEESDEELFPRPAEKYWDVDMDEGRGGEADDVAEDPGGQDDRQGLLNK